MKRSKKIGLAPGQRWNIHPVNANLTNEEEDRKKNSIDEAPTSADGNIPCLEPHCGRVYDTATELGGHKAWHTLITKATETAEPHRKKVRLNDKLTHFSNLDHGRGGFSQNVDGLSGQVVAHRSETTGRYNCPSPLCKMSFKRKGYLSRHWDQKYET